MEVPTPRFLNNFTLLVFLHNFSARALAILHHTHNTILFRHTANVKNSGAIRSAFPGNLSGFIGAFLRGLFRGNFQKTFGNVFGVMVVPFGLFKTGFFFPRRGCKGIEAPVASVASINCAICTDKITSYQTKTF